MNTKKILTRKFKSGERGAAMVTVILISILLVTASVAMLIAVGANTRNTTDVLAETKAYYAAESGLQATINVLRNSSTATYGSAAADPDLSTWLNYDWPTTGTADRIVIGDTPANYTANLGTAYSIWAVDPDNTGASLTFSTSGVFLSGGTISANGKTVYYPNETASPRTEITFTDAASTVNNFTGNPVLGTFTLVNVGAGATIPAGLALNFRIDYLLSAPRVGVKSIWGSITQTSSAAPKVVRFQSQDQYLLGSHIELCSASSGGPGCADVTFNLGSTPSVLYAYITPLQPYRLKVISTGFGPHGAVKKLEAILRRNLFNGLGSPAATVMLGPSTPPPGGLPFYFAPGTSNGITYSGGDCSSPSGCVPSFGVNDPNNLEYLNDHPPSGNPNQMMPPPQMITGSVPEWQQSPQNLDVLIDQLRTTAQNSGRYFSSNAARITNPGDFTAGTGITFCEGSCQVSGEGGGILVVTGMLTNLGGFSFKGLIIVTGEEGWDRNGGGNGQVIGNVVVAPYNTRPYIPENLSTTFLCPRYGISGGGGSDVIYGDIASIIDNTSAVSDFVAGVAEK
jgi:Tfp pilus assembly protein PilX